MSAVRDVGVIHKPAAAWSRDSLAAWQWLLDNTAALPHVGTHPEGCRIEFLRRWAVKILCLVNDEMPYSDWFWFLSNHFERELKRVDPAVRPLNELMFKGGEWEGDPAKASAA